MTPKIISLSGIDGCGKTAIAHSLSRILEKQEHKVKVIKGYYYTVPGFLGFFFNALFSKAGKRVVSEQYGKRKRSLLTHGIILLKTLTPLIDFIIFALFIRLPTLFRNRIIICDRLFPDQLVHILFTTGVDYGLYGSLYMKFAPKADVALWIDTPSPIAYKRKPEYEQWVFDEKSRLYLELSDLGYLHTIDQSALSADSIALKIYNDYFGS